MVFRSSESSWVVLGCLERRRVMRVYIVCSHTGHYQGVFRNRQEAEDYGKNNVDYGYHIFVEDL